MFVEIWKELGCPHVYPVPKEQFEEMEGVQVCDCYGISGDHYPILYIVPGMTPRARRNTIYHEILHLIMPRKPHWYIALAARVLADGGHRGEETEMNGHTVDDLPSRAALLAMARRASKRFNERC
jgi:hypothetical protein